MDIEFYRLDQKYLDGYIAKLLKITFSSGKNSVMKTATGFHIIGDKNYLKQAIAIILVNLHGDPTINIDCVVKKIFKKDSTCITNSRLTLKHHQKHVIKHFEKNRGLIAIHSVGTGKTLTAVTASQCFLKNNPSGKVIVVTPTSLQANFKKEMKQYDPDINDDQYSFYTLEGFSKADTSCKNTMLIIDEAHNIRTPVHTTRAGELKGKRANALITCSSILNAQKVLLLTATPIVNSLYDIENLIAIVDGRLPVNKKMFGILSHNKNYYKCKISVYIPDESETTKFYPSSDIREVFIPMPSEYEALYQTLEDKITESKGKTKKGDDAQLGAFFTSLRQASNKLDDAIDSPKIKWLDNFLDDHTDGKLVIFSHWLDAGLNAIKQLLAEKDISFLHIDGSMNQAKRLTAVTQYNSNKIRVLLISKAGGEGLDLKETKFMILMDPGWNPGTAEQVIGRGIRYKSHYHLPKDQQHVDVYKLFLIKQSEAGQAIPTLDEMREQKIKPAVDLYLRALANDKIEMIKYFMDMIRPLSIENNTC